MQGEEDKQEMVEDHFPVPKEVPKDVSLVESDVQSIHEKLSNYERLDTEERYRKYNAGT